VTPDSLWVLCLLLFLDGATFAIFTTVLLLQYGKLHAPWQVALFGGLASAGGSVVQLLVLRWLLGASQPWMRRLAPSREKLDAALRSYPSTLFLALVWARLTPLPDAPLKLVAAAIRYSPLRYGIAVYLGALPYYYVLALLGQKFRIPGWVLAIAVVVLAAGLALDLWRRRRREKSS
jgi:uncharacterized membrane protein YdjX (TVP38/TMEM64 family)